MALVNLNEVLIKARREKYAIAGFNVMSCEMLRGVIAAAEETKSPIILAYAEVFEANAPMDGFASMLCAEAKKASVPVVVHLDHARRLEYIKKAVDYGFSSVMIDASDKPFEENIAIAKETVELCKGKNITVEAELGHIGGLEGYAYSDDEVEEDSYTNVSEAKEFVLQTGIDALAVAIGTIHGVYKSTPKLSIERLKELAEVIDLPLVMHGGSGLSDDDFKNAIHEGISKINIFTDLTLRAMGASKKSEANNFIDFTTDIANAVKDEAIKKTKLFGSDGKA